MVSHKWSGYSAAYDAYNVCNEVRDVPCPHVLPAFNLVKFQVVDKDAMIYNYVDKYWRWAY